MARPQGPGRLRRLLFRHSEFVDYEQGLSKVITRSGRHVLAHTEQEKLLRPIHRQRPTRSFASCTFRRRFAHTINYFFTSVAYYTPKEYMDLFEVVSNRLSIADCFSGGKRDLTGIAATHVAAQITRGPIMTTKLGSLSTVLFALLISITLSTPAFADGIQITGAEAELEHGGTAADVFLNIYNTGKTADRLYAVKTPVAARAILSSLGENEERQVEVRNEAIPRALAYEVQPGEGLRLHHDGPHISLRELNRSLGVGHTFVLTLYFEQAGPVRVDVTVEDD